VLYLKAMRKASCVERIVERAGRLRRGLETVGVRPGSEVFVMCCADHSEDREVALLALEALGASAVIPAEWTRTGLGQLGGFCLACEEGVGAWQVAGARGVVIGDGPGVLWWKALECRHAAVPA
jgi:hypothetical protein